MVNWWHCQWKWGSNNCCQYKSLIKSIIDSQWNSYDRILVFHWINKCSFFVLFACVIIIVIIMIKIICILFFFLMYQSHRMMKILLINRHSNRWSNFFCIYIFQWFLLPHVFQNERIIFCFTFVWLIWQACCPKSQTYFILQAAYSKSEFVILCISMRLLFILLLFCVWEHFTQNRIIHHCSSTQISASI